MNRFMSIISSLVLSLLASSTLAGEINMHTKLTVRAAIAVDAQFRVAYLNKDLPWGTRVYLQYGFEQGEFQNGKLVTNARWLYTSELELKPTAAYVWQGDLTRELFTRGSSRQLSALQFVFKIVLPNGQMTYDKGSNGTLSYYQGNVPYVNSGCDSFQYAGCSVLVQKIN